VLAERKEKLAKATRRGSLQQNGIPVDRIGPTGFGGSDVLHSEPVRPDGVAGQAAGGEPRAWGKMEGLTLGSAPAPNGGAVVLPGAPGAQVRAVGRPALGSAGPIAAAKLAAQQQSTGGGADSDTAGFTDVFVDLPAGASHGDSRIVSLDPCLSPSGAATILTQPRAHSCLPNGCAESRPCSAPAMCVLQCRATARTLSRQVALCLVAALGATVSAKKAVYKVYG
jgi:hypothetical protein